MAKKKEISYEAAIKELEQLLAKVEGEEVNIDELSDLVKRSVGLIKTCKDKLKGIESEIDDSLTQLDD